MAALFCYSITIPGSGANLCIRAKDEVIKLTWGDYCQCAESRPSNTCIRIYSDTQPIVTRRVRFVFNVMATRFKVIIAKITIPYLYSRHFGTSCHYIRFSLLNIFH